MNLKTVMFRGKETEVEIDLDGGYESDTNCHVIEWHFHGLSTEQHDELNITDEENQDIYNQLAKE